MQCLGETRYHPGQVFQYNLSGIPAVLNGESWSTVVSVDYMFQASDDVRFQAVPVAINQVYTFEEQSGKTPYAGFFLSAVTFKSELTTPNQPWVTRVGGGPLPEGLLDDLVEHFARPESWSLYPEVLEVLTALRERGLKLFVVSNWDSKLPALLDRLDLTRHFDGVVVSALVGASKPAREIFDTALSLAGVAAHEALHVGDSPSEDYEGARNAGLPALLLDRAGIAEGGFESIRSLQEILPRVSP